jgi:hypothetical protein
MEPKGMQTYKVIQCGRLKREIHLKEDLERGVWSFVLLDWENDVNDGGSLTLDKDERHAGLTWRETGRQLNLDALVQFIGGQLADRLASDVASAR